METINALYTQTKQSLSFINNNYPNKGLQILKGVQKELKALKVANPQLQKQINQVEIITLNNLACAYNKKGKFKASLFNLQLVQAMQEKMFKGMLDGPKEQLQVDKVHQMATTHSNLCAVYSQTGKHEQALKQINLAIQYLQKIGQKSKAYIIFYYNCAIELQYLNDIQEAHKKATKGYSLCEGNDEMQKMFKECIDRLEGKIKKKQQKIGQYLVRKYKDGLGNYNYKQGLSLQEMSQTKKLPPIKNEISCYHTKVVGKRMRRSEYPKVRKVETLDNSLDSKHNSTFIMESRKKVISLYETKNEISQKNKLSLSKRKETLEKLCSGQK